MSTPPPPLPFQLALLNALLKSGPSGKQAVIDWLCDALACNASADATQPDERKVSSKAFLGNLCTVRGDRLSSSFFVFVLVFVFAPPLLLLFQYFFCHSSSRVHTPTLFTTIKRPFSAWRLLFSASKTSKPRSAPQLRGYTRTARASEGRFPRV